MTAGSPLVSIITPCYNAGAYLPDTIASVLGQSFTDWEWVVTDDCSTDTSPDLISAISDERVRLIRLTTNSGAPAAYNSSLDHARGRFITFIDADDAWNSSFLAVMLDAMGRRGDELAYCGYSRCDQHLQPMLSDFRATQDVTFNSLLRTCRLSTLATVYDSRRIGKIRFPLDSKREDHAMWLSVLSKIPVGRAVDQVLAKYRIHPTSRSANKLEMIRPQYEVYRQHLQFGRARSIFYTSAWAMHGALKYSR